MKAIFFILISLLLACSNKSETPKAKESEKVEVKNEAADTAKKTDLKKESPTDSEVKSDSKFEELSYSRAGHPKGLELKGKAKHGLRWRDKNGENWLVLSETQDKKDHHGHIHMESRDLYATHVVIEGEGVKVIRTVKELKSNCEFDWMASFDPRAISVSDLDKDGYGEATFSYRTKCASDVTNGPYKLFVLENGEKNVLRGTDILSEKQYQLPGDGTFKSEGFKDNKALLDHAKKVWEKTKTLRMR